MSAYEKLRDQLMIGTSRHGKSNFEELLKRAREQRGPDPTIDPSKFQVIGINEGHNIDADAYYRATVKSSWPTTARASLNAFTNAELVMEMLKRGFAVMKVPENGKMAEVVSGQTDSE